MGTLKIQFFHLGSPQNPQTNHHSHHYHTNLTFIQAKPSLTITYGLRNTGPRKPLWRSKRVLSNEAIQVVQLLKLAKSSAKLKEIFSSRLTRLLKADLIDTLAELQRQNELELALQVFEFIRKEYWYTPDLPLYSDMILLLGKNKLINKAEELFTELKKEGLKPDARAYTELIGAYFQVGMWEKAIETYELMKGSGCIPGKLTLMILIRNLEKAGQEELAKSVKRECEEYIEEPKKFLEEVERKYAKSSLDLV